jgi:23S rRNA (adenine1618-N6)-methyltransferase
LHPRNRHQGHYDFERLIKSCPDLEPFVSATPYNELSIDFTDPKAVRILNWALLSHFYGVSKWEIPGNYLCPPVPGRADYLHYAADLLSACNDGIIPRGDLVRALDIGVGASCIYPIIGHCEYGWRFVGADIDRTALASAKRIVHANKGLSSAVQLRLQTSPSDILNGLLRPNDVFDISVCNPPFHASLAEAHENSRRKWQNLGVGPVGKGSDRSPLLNFGGQGTELWCPGGEPAFVRQMIEESAKFPESIFWFSTLISRVSALPGVYAALKKARAVDIRTIDMAQGQKKSRIVAWTFLSRKRQKEWRMRRWEG